MRTTALPDHPKRAPSKSRACHADKTGAKNNYGNTVPPFSLAIKYSLTQLIHFLTKYIILILHENNNTTNKTSSDIKSILIQTYITV